MDLSVAKAPFVKTWSKSKLWPSMVEQHVFRALAVCKDIPQTMPVFAGGEVIGLVLGTNDGSGLAYYKPITHRQWMGFHSYDDLDAEVRRGKYYRCFFKKTTTDINQSNLWFDVWPEAGLPIAGDFSGTAATARQFDNTTNGALDLGPAVDASGDTRHLLGWKLTGLAGTNSLANQLIIYDRVLSYDAEVQSTSLTTMTNTNTAQRYASAGQSGMQIATTMNLNTLGVTTTNLTSLHYTNQGGTTGRSVSTAYTLPFWTNVTGGLPNPVCCPHDNTNNRTLSPFLPLQAGDQGVRKIEDYTSSANNTGTFAFALMRPIGIMWTQGSSGGVRVDFARSMFCLERVYDGACLSWLWMAATGNTASISGYLQVGWG